MESMICLASSVVMGPLIRPSITPLFQAKMCIRDSSWTPEKGKRAFICHGDCMEDAKFMEAAILERHSDAEITIFHMGPIIGAHCGPGVIALFFWGSER